MFWILDGFYNVMEYKLSSKQVEDIRKTFHYLDTKKENKIQPQDVTTLLKLLGQNLTSQEEDEVRAKHCNCKGCTGYDVDQVIEIVKEVGLKSKEEVYNELIMAFRAMDADGNGCITKQELSKYMRTVGDPLSKEEVDEMMELADIDKNGVIDWYEFVTVLCQHIM